MNVPVPHVLQAVHTVSFVPAHPPLAYWDVPHALHALQTHSLPTYCPTEQLVRGHGPHTVSCHAVHAVITNVPFVQLEHRAHVMSCVDVHSRAMNSPASHRGLHPKQTHPLLRYW